MSPSILKTPPSEMDHHLGDLRNSVVIVEYGDFECAFCAAAEPAFKKIREEFETDLCFIFRHFPLTSFHPHAALAALSSEVADLQGKFWPMHDQLFANSRSLSADRIVDIALDLRLDMNRFQLDFEKNELIDRVQRDYISAFQNQIISTPTVFINERHYRGAMEYDELREAVIIALGEAGAAASFGF
jgi:protein-disulfide isomerase